MKVTERSSREAKLGSNFAVIWATLQPLLILFVGLFRSKPQSKLCNLDCGQLIAPKQFLVDPQFSGQQIARHGFITDRFVSGLCQLAIVVVGN